MYCVENLMVQREIKGAADQVCWLMPVILATQEAEIRRIKIQSLPRQIVRETLSQNNLSQKG
jgi:hypothetical protein